MNMNDSEVYYYTSPRCHDALARFARQQQQLNRQRRQAANDPAGGEAQAQQLQNAISGMTAAELATLLSAETIAELLKTLSAAPAQRRLSALPPEDRRALDRAFGTNRGPVVTRRGNSVSFRACSPEEARARIAARGGR